MVPRLATAVLGGLLFAALAYGQDPASFGPQMLVNSTVTGAQTDPSVCTNELGTTTLVVWRSEAQDGDQGGIYGQFFDPAGRHLGPEVRINTTTAQDQRHPVVACSGEFLTVWESLLQDGSGSGVYAQEFHRNGSQFGSEFRVNATTSGQQDFPASSISRSRRGVVVLWEDAQKDGNQVGVFAQKYSMTFDGNIYSVGSEFQVNTTTASNQGEPAACFDPNDRLLVVWQSFGQDGSQNGIFGQLYSSNGTPIGGEIPINATTLGQQRTPSPTCLQDSFVVVWEGEDGDSSGIFGRRLDRNAQPLGSDFQVNVSTAGRQYNARVRGDDNGFFVVWESQAPGTATSQVLGRLFPSDGLPPSRELTFNLSAAPSPAAPDIGEIAFGYSHFWATVVWHGSSGGDNSGILARTLDLKLPRSFGSETLVNTHTPGDQLSPHVAADSAGNFVAVWSGLSPEGSSLKLFGQRFSSIGSPRGMEFQVNTSSLDRFPPTPAVAMDPNGAFLVVWDSPLPGGPAGSRGIVGQRFGKNGKPRGEEFRANVSAIDQAGSPSATVDAAGDFVLAWQAGIPRGIYTRLFGSNGAPRGGELRVSSVATADQTIPRVGSDANGNFVILWRGSNGLLGRRFNASGKTLGAEFGIEAPASQHDVSMDAQGSFVAVWNYAKSNPCTPKPEGTCWDASGCVEAQRYDRNGTPQGQHETVACGGENYKEASGVAHDAQGNFVVAWTAGDGCMAGGSYNYCRDSCYYYCCYCCEWRSYCKRDSSTDGSGDAVFARRFRSDGVALGAPFRINDTTAGDQTIGRVAGYGRGHYIVVWNSPLQGTEVVAKVVTPPPEPVPGNIPAWIGALSALAGAAGLGVRRARKRLRRIPAQAGTAPPAS
jgi:large repetitive protein